MNIFTTAIVESERITPNKPAIITPTYNTSYHELLVRTGRVMALLEDLRAEGGVVFVDINEPSIFISVMLACMDYGVIPLALPPHMSLQNKTLLAKRIKPIMRIVDFAPDVSPVDQYDKLIGYEWVENCVTLPHPVKKGDILHFTSGSCGEKKIVIRPKGNLEAEAISVLDALNPHSVLLTTPLSHSFTCGIWRATILRGGTIITMPNLPIYERIIATRKLLKTYRPEYLFGVPYIFSLLARQLVDVSSVTSFCGGETLTSRTHEVWERVTHTPLRQEYGLGEGGITLLNTETNYSGNHMGKPIPNVKCKLINMEDNVGELVVHREHPPTRYLFEEKDNTFMCDGGIKTGDLIRKVGGKYFFESRLKRVLIRGGLKVTCEEIESAIMDFEGVEDVVVTSEISQAGLGDTIVAHIVLPSNRRFDMQEFIKTKLNPYKVPHKFRYYPALPRTESGKVDRNALR